MLIVQAQALKPNAMPFYARLEGDTLTPLGTSPFSDKIRLRDERIALGEVRLLPPIIPSKVLCIGRNYRAHAEEMGNEVPPEPLVFMKPSSSVIGPGDLIRLPALSERVDHEGEMALVIKSRCRRVSEEDAANVILGITALNDVTARDLQKRDGQWTRAKGFDTFCPIGPAIAIGLDPSDLAISTRVNGETRQQSRTSLMIHRAEKLVAHITAFTTLYPGDVIATGTPEGIGRLSVGDTVDVELEGVGTLTNPVAADE